MPRFHFTMRDIDAFPERIQQQIRAQLDAMATRRPPREPEQAEGAALEHQGIDPFLLVDPACPLTVRLVRVGGRRMDDDNIVAGYKALRDAIAATLGRAGDSERDGMRWEYATERGEEDGTRVEVRTMRECIV